VIVLGFDGADARTVGEMMDRGELPNLARLRDTGTFAPLATTVPAESPVSWASLNSGQNPAKTGVPGFVKRSLSSGGTPIPSLGFFEVGNRETKSLALPSVLGFLVRCGPLGSAFLMGASTVRVLRAALRPPPQVPEGRRDPGRHPAGARRRRRRLESGQRDPAHDPRRGDEPVRDGRLLGGRRPRRGGERRPRRPDGVGPAGGRRREGAGRPRRPGRARELRRLVRVHHRPGRARARARRPVDEHGRHGLPRRRGGRADRVARLRAARLRRAGERAPLGAARPPP
jgi:hypothetical protein